MPILALAAAIILVVVVLAILTALGLALKLLAWLFPAAVVVVVIVVLATLIWQVLNPEAAAKIHRDAAILRARKEAEKNKPENDWKARSRR